MNPFLAVFIGGGIGSVARYAISLMIKRLDVSALPFATLTANMLSTLVLGWMIYKLMPMHQTWLYPLIAIGFCGGFSTFSTFSLETFQLIKSDQIGWAISNVLVSIAACLIILYFISKNLK